MSGWLTPEELVRVRGEFAAGNATTATVLRRDPTNASPRGGEGGPFGEVGTISGRLRQVRMTGREAALGGRTTNTEDAEFLCMPPGLFDSYGQLDVDTLDETMTLSGLTSPGDLGLTVRDRLRIGSVEWEINDIDTGRSEQLVQVVTLRKAV